MLCRFIEEKSSFEYGQVNHALAAAMRTLVKEYMILITQLEHLQRQGLLSLQKLWFYIQPTMRTMEILASLGEGGREGWCVSLSFFLPVPFLTAPHRFSAPILAPFCLPLVSQSSVSLQGETGSQFRPAGAPQ